jgi:hypothetical protein
MKRILSRGAAANMALTVLTLAGLACAENLQDDFLAGIDSSAERGDFPARPRQVYVFGSVRHPTRKIFGSRSV